MSAQNSRSLLPLYLACYALWIAASALAGWLVFAVRPVLFDLGVRLRLNPWQVRAVDEFGVVALGLAWLVAIFLLEHYLRQGVVKRRLWRRAARVLIVEAAALGLCYAAQLAL